MQHRKRLLKLGRPRDHRKALLKNLCASLVHHERIITTRTQAKALSSYLEKAITMAKKKDTMNAYRRLKQLVFDQTIARKIVGELKERYKDKSSGFTRITAIKYRSGDNASLVQIELI